MAEMNVESPAAAFARQARAERLIENALEQSLRGFFSDLLTLAGEQGMALGAATTHAAWAERTSPDALAEWLTPEQAEYVSGVVALSSVPDAAHATVTTVFQAAAENQWSAEEVQASLAEAFDLDGQPAFLTAAAPSPRTRDAERAAARRKQREVVAARSRTARAAEAARAAPAPAARRSGSVWDDLDGEGMSWMNRMKVEARTAVTGLDGLLSTQEMARRGIPFKMWVSRRDNRVRDTHVGADAQVVPVGEPFTVGGSSMMYPGDRSAPPEETVNCRCIVIGIAKPAKTPTSSGQRWQPVGKRRKTRPGPTSKRKRLTASGDDSEEPNPD